jgi:hypothetical protein
MKIHPLIAALAVCIVLGSIIAVTRLVDRGPEHFFSSAAPRAPEEHSRPRYSPGIFHEPQTEVERALDKILRLDLDDDGSLFNFIAGAPYSNPAKSQRYAQLFTRTLLDAWRKAEADLVRINCGGKYIEGDLCGFNYDPIICGQDSPDRYVYRTIKSEKGSASVVTAWPDMLSMDWNYFTSYRLVNENTRWKLDGVDCGTLAKFNMPSTP